MHFYKQMEGSFRDSTDMPEKLTPHFLPLVDNLIKLKLQSGATWHVELIRLSQKLVLQSGWTDFITANDVLPNDLLVFKYIGGFEFEVVIFDPLGYEKSGNVEETSSDSSMQLVKKSHEREEETGYDKFAKILDTKTPAKMKPNQNPRKRKMASGDVCCSQHGLLKSDNAEVAPNWTSMDFARMHFCKQMSGSSMHNMSLPMQIKMNLKGLIGKVLQLKRPSGDTWQVSLILLGEELVLQSGWNQFILANDISQNDILAFKFIGGSTFEVLIFNADGCGKSSNMQKETIKSKPDNCDKKLGEIKVYRSAMEDEEGSSSGGNCSLDTELLACGVRGRNPTFAVILKRSSLTVQCGITIPKNFSAEHLPKESQHFVLYCPEKKKTWRVNYLYSENQQFIRYAGWGMFVRDNNLQEGDVCLFGLVKTSEPITFVVCL